MEGKRLRVVDFRSISDGGGEGNTLWYYQDAPVRKRAERCRYQSFAFRVDTAKVKEEKVPNAVSVDTFILFLFHLFFPKKNNAITPALVCAPITGPMSHISTVFTPKFFSIRVFTRTASS